MAGILGTLQTFKQYWFAFVSSICFLFENLDSSVGCRDPNLRRCHISIFLLSQVRAKNAGDNSHPPLRSFTQSRLGILCPCVLPVLPQRPTALEQHEGNSFVNKWELPMPVFFSPSPSSSSCSPWKYCNTLLSVTLFSCCGGIRIIKQVPRKKGGVGRQRG